MSYSIHLPIGKQIFFTCLVFITLSSYAQNVGIGTTTPHSSAAVDINSTNKGALLPRMTTAQRNAITNPAVGLLVFDLDKNALYLFIGSNWQPLSFTSDNNLPPLSRFASDHTAGDNFGGNVSILGDYVLIGAFMDQIGSNVEQGSVYVFKKTSGTWSEQAKLVASDGSANDWFGTSVSLYGNFALVGAAGDDTAGKINQGSAYIFERTGNTWVQRAKLWAFDGAAGDNFGYTVLVSGNYFIVGAPRDDGVGVDQGSVHIFQTVAPNTWDSKAKLIASDGQAYDNFGFSLAMSGADLFIGSPGQYTSGSQPGAVYHFWDDGSSGEDWYFQIKLTASDGMQRDWFGSSISIDGDFLVIGAPYKDIGTNVDQGAVYLFYKNADVWTQQQVLTAEDGVTYDRFGHSVSIFNFFIVVGAQYDDIGNNADQGSAYVFERVSTTFRFRRKVEELNGSAGYHFGASVGVWGFDIVIGSPFNSSVGYQAGSVSFLNVQ